MIIVLAKAYPGYSSPKSVGEFYHEGIPVLVEEKEHSPSNASSSFPISFFSPHSSFPNSSVTLSN